MSFREAIEQWGAHLRFLPRSSPDFNPVELAFAKLKPLLRKAAARTTEDLWTAIAATHDAFIPPECSTDLPNHDTSQKDRKTVLESGLVGTTGRRGRRIVVAVMGSRRLSVMIPFSAKGAPETLFYYFRVSDVEKAAHDCPSRGSGWIMDFGATIL